MENNKPELEQIIVIKLKKFDLENNHKRQKKKMRLIKMEVTLSYDQQQAHLNQFFRKLPD